MFCEHCGQTTHKLNEVMDRPVAKSLVEVVQRDQSIPIVEMKQ